jgi:hypothetical protein
MGSRSEPISARISKQTKARVAAYATQHGITQSSAAAVLIVAGLNAQRGELYDHADPGEPARVPGWRRVLEKVRGDD